jgi:hypothetical protein
MISIHAGTTPLWRTIKNPKEKMINHGLSTKGKKKKGINPRILAHMRFGTSKSLLFLIQEAQYIDRRETAGFKETITPICNGVAFRSL